MPSVHSPAGHHSYHLGPTSSAPHQASGSRPRSPSSPLRSAMKKPKAAGNEEDPISEAAVTSTMDHHLNNGGAHGVDGGDTVTVTSLGIPALRAARSTVSMFNAEPMTALAEEDSVRSSPARGMVAAAPQAAPPTVTMGTAVLGSPMLGADETTRVVSQLLETEVGLNVLLEQVKRNLVSAKDIVTFLKKRAAIEEEYGRSMQRLCTSLTESLDKDEGKAGAYSECIRQMVSIHDTVATNRLAFATNITQVAEELNTVHKDTERSRRQLKDAGERHEKNLTASEQALEKAKAKHEAATEAWERSRQSLAEQAGGANSSVGSLHHGSGGGGGGMVMTSNGHGGFGMSKLSTSSSRAASFFGMSKNPEKEEEQARHRAARANDAYQTQLSGTVATRAEFQSTHLPGLLRSLKEVNDECDIALQYHLSKYAFHYEQTLTADAHALCPSVTAAGAAAVAAGNPLAGGMGIRKLFEHMDHAGDLQKVIQQAAGGANKPGNGSGPRPLAVAAATSTAALSTLSLVGPPTRPVFGVSLMDLAERDDSDVPRLLTVLTRLVEEVGIEVVGLYRASGSHPVIQSLRALCDRDLVAVPWRSEEVLSDVHNVTGLLKLFLRSLPDSVIPKAMTREFVAVAKMSNDPRNQLLSLHETINRLPDPHYATLRVVIQHLDRVAQHAGRNRMSWANLSIVFGPALMHSGVVSAPNAEANGKAGKGGDSSDGGSSGTDMHYQCKVVELILKNCRILFEADES